MAAEAMSPAPVTTGVPSGIPRSSEAFLVILPALSVDFLISGSFELSILYLFKMVSDHRNFPGRVSINQLTFAQSLLVTNVFVHL